MTLIAHYAEFLVFWDAQNKWIYTEFALCFYASFTLAFSPIVSATSTEKHL